MKSDSLTQLLRHCNQFVEDQRISCSETIYQTDRVIAAAYEFIEGVCNIVGYHKDDDENDDDDENEGEV